MSRIRFLMIGGFLGAGKTTAIARIARHYMDGGRSVGLVTNDQAYHLVDTHALRAQGFRVGEVPGACFCCQFDDLVQTAQSLAIDERPDVIITEPVGSCTDLVATVIEPLRAWHGDEYDLAPLVVLLKPEHGTKILADRPGVGFSPKAAYIFLKQIEEADVVAINKLDKLSPEQRDELIDLVRHRYPQKSIMGVSAKTGDGFDRLLESLEQPGPTHTSFMDVDYQLYGEGEAELGWLNCNVTVTSTGRKFSLDELLMDTIGGLQTRLVQTGAEPAHLKLLGQAGEDSAVANVVGSDVAPELSRPSRAFTRTAQVIVNARVATDPDELAQLLHRALQFVAEQRDLTFDIKNLQNFRPQPPVPTHRVV